MSKNFYHPHHEIFTREYGWMPIDRLFEKYANKKMLHIGEYDVFTNTFSYTNNYEVITSSVRSCTYLFGKYVGSMVQFNVHPDCEIMVSVDGGKTKDFLTANEIHQLQLDEKVISFYNLESVYDMKNDQTPRLYTEQYKENYTFNRGILYGLVTNTGCILTKYRGKFSILGCFVHEDEE